VYIYNGKNYRITKTIKGKDLIGLEYEPLFPYYQDTKNAFQVVAGDFVSTEEGTGVVHIAPAFGEADFQVGKRENIPLVQHVSLDGKFKPEVTDFAGLDVKPKDDPSKTDIEIVKWLAHNGKLFSKQKFEHSYPHCWRCDTPLLNYTTSSWFVKVTAIKDKAIKLAQEINWSPEHIKEGRFGKWLAGARDWSISRQRFWASVMPVWQCHGKKQETRNKRQGCDNMIVFGSVAELEQRSGKKIDDLHKHIVDLITFPCETCGGTMKRVPDVLDTWFDSGAMPYAQAHYPFENKEKFESHFPAEFIAEGQDQTRAWFYYLQVLATALFSKIAFKNVIVNGIVLAEDGKKMSKKLQNYPDPNLLMEKYGADALRYYLMSSVVTQAENLCFSERGVDEAYKKVILILWNVFSFYQLYERQETGNKRHVISDKPLDRWIVTKLHLLIKEVTAGFENYDIVQATRPLAQFIDELSTWYLRRSRERFKAGGEDKEAALATLKHVLVELAKVMAPVMPFLAERIYQEVGVNKESVHLQNWPAFDKKLIDQAVLQKMDRLRALAAAALALRAAAGLKVRQPLAEVLVTGADKLAGYLDLLKDELNVLAVAEFKEGLSSDYAVKEEPDFKIAIKITLSQELKTAGLARELTRQVNKLRKEAGLTISDQATLYYQTDSPLIQRMIGGQAEEIKRATLCADLISRPDLAAAAIEIDGENVKLMIVKETKE